MTSRRAAFVLCFAAFGFLDPFRPIASAAAVMGGGREIGSNVSDPNGNVYDYVLQTGASVSVMADAGQVTRVMFMDQDNGIVAVELSGPGVLTVALENVSVAVTATKYNESSASYWNRPGTRFVRGSANLAVTSSDQNTNVSVFSIGPATVADQTLFRSDGGYRGITKINGITIVGNGQFGALRCGNALFSRDGGFTGIVADGVQFTGSVFIGDLDATGSATPYLRLGSASDTRVVGGDLRQTNGSPVFVTGVTNLQFVAGVDSNGSALPAGSNQGQLVQYVPSPALPTVTSFTPNTLVAGAQVTLTGANFIGATTVRFNGVAATTFTVVSPTQITAIVPAGATPGPITVETTGSGGGTGPVFSRQPESLIIGLGESATFTTAATGSPSFEWQRNGTVISGTTGPTLTVDNVSAGGIYRAKATGAGGSTLSRPAVLGVWGSGKITGGGVEVGSNIYHPNGTIYDQVLMTGTAVTVTADPGQLTKIAFIDPDDDLVTLEFSGAGIASVVLDAASGPAAPVKYNQPGVQYVKGRATVVVIGANETTNLTIYSVGRANSVNQAIFQDTTYDGVADIAAVAILSDTGRFGALYTGNTRYGSDSGLTGVFAPGIQFLGRVLIGDIAASGTASPALVVGSILDLQILGGDFLQPNAEPMLARGFAITDLKFGASTNSHGAAFPAQINHAQFVDFGASDGSGGQVVEDGVDQGPSLTVSDGASHSHNTLNIAQGAGTTGAVTITHPGTVYAVSNGAVVGDQGTGTLAVQDHAQFSGNGWMGVGSQNGGNGSVVVDGVGSALGAADGLTLGNDAGSTGSVIMRNGASAQLKTYANVGWEGTGTFRIESGADVTLDAAGAGDGSFGIGTRNGTSAAPGGSATVIGAGSTLDIDGAINLGAAGGYGVFTVDDSAFADVGRVYVHNGVVNVDYFGALRTKGTGNIDIDAGGAFRLGAFTSVQAGSLNNAGTLTGYGLITAGNLNNSGLVSPGLESTGFLTVTGNFNQSPAGRTRFDFSTTGPDRLVVEGNLNLDGTVEIAFAPGFTPVSGQGYQVMEWTGSRSLGSHLVFTGLTQAGGWTLLPVWTATSLSLLATNSAGGGPPQNDPFDSNANWTLDLGQSSGSGWVDVQNGRLEYTTKASPGPTTHDQRDVIPGPDGNFGAFGRGSNVLVGRLTSNWAVSVDAHVRNFALNAGAPTTPRNPPGQGYYVTLLVLDLQNALFNHGLAIAAKYDATWDDRPKGSVANWSSPSLYQDFDATGRTDFKLAAVYSAATRTLAAYVSIDGGTTWQLQSAFDVTAPVEAGGWGMSAGFSGPAFGIKLSVNSTNLAVGSGDIYFDNFTSTGLTEGAFPLYAGGTPPPPAAFPGFTWRNPLPTGGTLESVIFAQGKFLAAGIDGRVLTSVNGTAWSQVGNVPMSRVYSLAYSGTLYVAVGADGRICTSPDAVTWTQRAQTSNGRWLFGVAFAGGTYVAVGGDILSSVDGVNWTVRASLPNANLQAVAATAGRFVAVGDNGTLRTSPDGITWSAATPPAGYESAPFNNVAWLNGQFIAVGGNGTVLSSPDGVTWTPRNTGFPDWLQAVAYNGGSYLVTGGFGALLSTDLVTWSRVPIDSLAPFFSGTAGAGRFVLVGGGGEIWSSPTGQEWTSRGSTGGTDHLGEVRHIEGGFVAVGSNGLVMTSADGASWVRRPTPVGHWLSGITKGAGLYVIVSAFGDVLTSPDLATWTNHPIDDHFPSNAVAFGNSRFVAVGEGGRVRTSGDGLAWTSFIPPGVSVSLRSVATLGNLFVAVGDSGKIYTSADGTSWTERTSGTPMNLWRVRNLEGTLFAVGDNRTVLVSADGVTWVSIATPNDYNTFGYSFRDIARLGDGYYVASSQGQLVKTSRLSATDASEWTRVARIAAGEDLHSLDVGDGRLAIVGQGGALLDSALPVQPAAPAIAIPPLGQKVEAGANVILSVVATGNGPLTYQWKKDGTDLAGATSAMLVLANAQPAAGGSYTVTVRGPGGSPAISTPVTVAVGAPVISSGTTAGGTVGSIFTYTVTATNAPTGFSATGLPAGLAINAATGVITGTPAAAGRFDISISATNAGGSATQGVALFIAAAGADTFPNFAWRNPLPAGGTLQTVTYGQGRFFAGGGGGRVLTSTDGAVWSVAGTGPSGYVNSLCAAGPLLVSAGGNGVWTSADGVAWTQRAQPSYGLNGVTFADGRYVAVGWNGTILTSVDGLAWTARNSPRSDGLQSVAGTTGRYVIAGQNGTILTSVDAVTWSVVAAPAGYESQYFNGVAFLGGTFIIVTGNDAILTSADGTNWVVRSTGLGDGFRAVAYDGANYVLLGSHWTGSAQVATAAVSGDLVSWSRSPIEAAAPIAAGAAGGGQFVGVGAGGEIQSSGDGRQWVARGSMGGAWQLYDAVFANGQFVAVGSEGWLSVSTDGVSWTRRPTNFSNWLNGVAYGAGQYAAAHYGGVLTSPDSLAWTEHDFGDNTNHWGVAYANNQFVLVGDNGHIHTSTDGINWSLVTGTGITMNLQSVAALGSRFVVVGDNGGIYTSTTPASGSSWVARPSGTSENLHRVRAIDGALFAVGDNRTVLVSGDGLAWVAQQPNFNGYSNRDIVRLPDGYYVASNGNLVKSSDLTTWSSVAQPASGEDLWAFATGAGKVILAGQGGALLESALPAPPAAPTIIAQPQGKSFAPGDNLILSVLARGSGPLGYQWMKSSSPVPGATGAVLVLPDAQLADAGSYTVVVTDGTSTVTSSPAVVALNATSVPVITANPISIVREFGQNATFTAAASGTPTFTWQHNGAAVAGATGSTLTLNNVQPADTGLYRLTATGSAASAVSRPAVLGVSTTSKVVGAGTEILSNYAHPNGNTYDYILLTGSAATATADAGQLTRLFFIDPNDDIVAVEFGGAGSVSIVLAGFTGPAAPVNYNSTGSLYMKGRATITVAGANETTNLAVFSVGRATEVNQSIFRDDVTYDGVADIEAVAILSGNGKFGGLRVANARFAAGAGLTGVFAPGVQFQGPVFVGDIDASGSATPALVVGSVSDIRITGGDLLQTNGQPVVVSGFAAASLPFVAGGTSAGVTLPAQANLAQFVEYGVVIIAQPQNVAVISGQAASFEVTAGGQGTLSYQWRRFGYPIAGATARTYAIPAATRLDADYYDVVVTDAQSSATSKMARLDVAPTAYPGQLGIDPGWSVPVEGARVAINQIVPLAGGGFLAAGDLVRVDGHRTGAIARFAANGTVDTTFTSPIRGVVSRIAVQPDGKILAVGTLMVETAGGTRTGLVRLNADGSLDETFASPSVGDGTAVAVTANGKIYAAVIFEGGAGYQLWRLNSDGSRDESFAAAYAPGTYVRAIALQPDGNLLVSAVTFTLTSSTNELGRLLAADGSRDDTFTPPAVAYVPNLLAGPAGKIYVTGFFESNSGPEVCGRLNTDGTWDATFARLPVAGSIRALTLEAGGSVVIAGDFFQVDGNPRAVVARFNADGTLAAGQPGFGTDVGLAAIAALPNGELLVAERGYAAPTSTHLVRVKTDNSIDRSVDPMLRASGVIKSIVRQPGGRLVIAGDFNTIAGVERRYLARLDAAGAVDLSFAPGGGPNGMVQALKPLADGSLLAMGVFTEVDGVSRPAWARLSADGVRDPSFSGTGGVSASANDKYALLPLPGGGAIVSSWWFNEIFSGGCIRLNADGSYDAAFTAALGPSGHPIASLVQPDGKIVLGGFSWAGRNSTLMRLNPDGSVDYNYGLLPNPLAAAITADDRLWVATPDGLLRFLPDGQPDGSFHFPGAVNFGFLTVPDLVPQNDGKLIVPAQVNFTAVTSNLVAPGPGVLRVNADGSLDPTFGVAGLAAPATAIVQDDSGRLYLAADGALRRTRALAVPAISSQPGSTTADPGATVILSVTATGDYVTYQWFKDGVAMPGARTAQHAIPAITIADAGTYTVKVTNNAGSVTSAASVLTVSGSPITRQPASRAVGAGTGVTFNVGTAGAGPFTYRWTKNGASVDDDGRITGATTATLSIANVATGDAGAYAVVVGHGSGSATSGTATLAVIDAHATHSVASGGYRAGGSVTITSTVTYAGVLSSLGWSVLPPDGWSYAASAGQAGDVKPAAGDTDLLEWAWTTVPPSPVTFSYTLYVPAGTNGTQGLTALVLPRQAGTQFQLVVPPDPLPIGPSTHHSADTNHDLQLSLTELLRVIELYNTHNGSVRTGCYMVDAANHEDGFAPAATRSNTAVVILAQYHSGDSNHDGKLSLTELLRMIELYNYRSGTVRTGQYHVDPLNTEDGFAPGSAP